MPFIHIVKIGTRIVIQKVIAALFRKCILMPMPAIDISDQDFPAEIKKERTRLKMRQEDAARAVGVSVHTWNIWETGINAPLHPTKIGVLSILKSSKAKK